MKHLKIAAAGGQANNHNPFADINPAATFTDYEEMRKKFSKVTSGEILADLGYEFFWQKSAGERMVLFARKDYKNFCLLCTVGAPGDFAGTGLFTINYPYVNNTEAGILLNFYRYSGQMADLSHLVHNEGQECFQVGAIHFDKRETEKFYNLAESRFHDIR